MKKTKRVKKHPEYYAIKAYQILQKLTDDDMAKHLGVTRRTYCDKVNGYSDFTLAEGAMVARILNKTQDEIFLI